MLSELKDNDPTPLNKGTIVIDFTASWCPPCKAMAPIVGELASARPDIEFYTVDVDESTRLVKRFNVGSMPTFVKLIDGVEVDRQIGATSRDKFREFVE